MEAFEAEIKKEEAGRLTYVKVPFDARACLFVSSRQKPLMIRC